MSDSSPKRATPQALWIAEAGRAELRPAEAEGGGLRLQALVSGISRGTESLVFNGKVPSTEWQRMRCPNQEGEFAFPVKYGYAMVGRAESGARFFALHPHQSHFTISPESALPVPDNVSSERAVLAPQIETALNATWDAASRIGDRIAVVGGGVIGCLVAYLCGRMPGVDVTLIDLNPNRREIAAALGVPFRTPDETLPTGCDLVFHASGKAAGLNLAMNLAGFEATVVEMSWYGAGSVAAELGGAFHSQRLTLLSSQVGSVAPARRARWDHRRRLSLALSLCADPSLGVLVREETPFAELPARLPQILAAPDTLCHLIRYPQA